MFYGEEMTKLLSLWSNYKKIKWYWKIILFLPLIIVLVLIFLIYGLPYVAKNKAIRKNYDEITAQVEKIQEDEKKAKENRVKIDKEVEKLKEEEEKIEERIVINTKEFENEVDEINSTNDFNELHNLAKCFRERDRNN